MNEVSKYITIIRPEFMTFCQDACKAAALNHLLFRIAYKCKDQPKERIQAGDVLWYAKTELLTSEMSDAWGVCKVRKEVNDLVDMGLVGRTKDPTWGANRTKHFFFGSEQCQVFIDLCEKHDICIVHLGLPAEVVHLIYSSNANDKSIKCSCPEGAANDKSIKCKSYIHQMEVIDLSNANDKSIEAITEESIQKITTEDTNKEEDTEAPQSDPTNEASATPSTPTLENTEYLPDLTSTEQDSYSPVPPVSGYEKKEEDEDVRGSDRTGPTPGTEVPAPPAPVVPQTRNTTHGGQTRQSTAATRQGKGTTGRTQPEKPAGRGVKGNTSNKVYFSLEGSAFRTWWEEYTGTQLDETAANARACNALGKKESVTQANTKMVTDEISVNEWVSEKNVAVTPQDLANDESKLRWEKWLQSARRRAARAAQKQKDQQSAPQREPGAPINYTLVRLQQQAAAAAQKASL